jgi:hypothetical protein
MLCVVQTQLHKKQVGNLICTLGLEKSFVFSSSCHSGALDLFWNNEIKIGILLVFSVSS